MKSAQAWGLVVGEKLRPLTYKTRRLARVAAAWTAAYFVRRGEKVRVVRVEVRLR